MYDLNVECYSCHREFSYQPGADLKVVHCPHCGKPQTPRHRFPSGKAIGLPVVPRSED